MRQAAVQLLLLASTALVSTGVATWSPGAALITGGIGLAGWTLFAVRELEP